MQPKSDSEYKTLLSEVIKKQIVILGPDITLAKARNVPGLVVDDQGNVTEISGEPQNITQALIDQFVQLSGLIVKKTMEPLLSYHPEETKAAAPEVVMAPTPAPAATNPTPEPEAMPTPPPPPPPVPAMPEAPKPEETPAQPIMPPPPIPPMPAPAVPPAMPESEEKKIGEESSPTPTIEPMPMQNIGQSQPVDSVMKTTENPAGSDDSDATQKAINEALKQI